MSSYRNQLRATLFKIWNKKIKNRHFLIVDSKNERTLGLLLPIERNLHLPNWLWYHGWKIVDYHGVVSTNIPKQIHAEDDNVETKFYMEHKACMLLEVRKLEPGDKQYATHPRNKEKTLPISTEERLKKQTGALPKEST